MTKIMYVTLSLNEVPVSSVENSISRKSNISIGVHEYANYGRL